MKFSYHYFLVITCLLVFHNCARKGRPEGGPKDEDAPIMVVAKPDHKSLNFNQKEIRIYFDEYVVLRDLNKQLIISPPFKLDPLITPQGTPSKYINIKILDSLKKNTTYTFNFGDAIKDNNENNTLENFKYVFSTGDLIDSLNLNGSVKDIFKKELAKNYSVLLYKADSTYNDSIPFKRKPDYVTKTFDSINFKFTNIKEGKYFVMAIDEEASDYKFNPNIDKIGFIRDTISLPKDSLISSSITLFKEKLPYKFKRGKEISKGKIQFGFIGDKKIKVKLLSKVPETFKSASMFDKEKDTLNYWHTPIKVDSLNFLVTYENTIDTSTVFLRKKKIDSLSISKNIKNILHLTDTLKITTNNPIHKIDTTKFTLVDNDTLPIQFELKKLSINEIGLIFKKKPKKGYVFIGLPNAIEDFYGIASKDTLNYTFNTKEVEDYGNIILNLKKEIDSPVIIELLLDKEIIQKRFVKTSKTLEFKLLEPREYTIRAIIDENGNNKWDSGKLIGKVQPEKIIYLPEILKMRANWSINQEFIIK